MIAQETQSLEAVFACLDCSQPLSSSSSGEQLRCSACGKSWPVREGVPRFFEPEYYWGEVPQDEAELLVSQARELGWRNAIMQKFPQDRDMQISLMDWQRASWMPLLGLSPDAVALDIGCGNGAITHSVARGVKQLYSLEAIPQRIEFTRTRLEQDGIKNVRLVQATALNPPFQEKVFDLIVVNGVLEWVGEWIQEGDPRDVQLNFLRRLRKMLKPDGVLMVGIENRFGMAALQGTMDHSGMPYTSLMPRGVATWYLRRHHGKHYRTELNAKLEYRTYTYTKGGFQKLLADGGFPETSFYWADPGYNQPYELVPLEKGLVNERVKTALAEPGLTTSPLKRSVKKLAADLGVMPFLSSDFVILASSQRGLAELWKSLRSAIPAVPDVVAPRLALSSAPFGLKSVIQVFAAGERTPRCVIKTTTVDPDSQASFDREVNGLKLINRALDAAPGGFATPRLLGESKHGYFSYAAETVAPGQSLTRLAFTEGDAGHARKIFEQEIPRAIAAAVQFAKMLRGQNTSPAPESYWNLPENTGLEADLSAARLAGATDWVQHGDYTVDNILSAGAGPLWVIDWEHIFQGGSPLHDLFSLLVSLVPVVEVEADASGRWQRQFESAFFGSGYWNDKFREWVKSACGQLGIPTAQAWGCFLQFLLFRYRHFDRMTSRGAPQARLHEALLRSAAGRRSKFLLPS